MASAFQGSARQLSPEQYDLLLRETNHRCSNDLQLVVGLLSLQSRNSKSDEVRAAMGDAMQRVAVLARARSALSDDAHSLESALREVCKALHSQAEPRSVEMSLDIAPCAQSLSPSQILIITLVVNELATNAIKHAFESAVSGKISIALREHGPRHIAVIVDDDGIPFPQPSDEPGRRKGLGLDLVIRLVASTGGILLMPSGGSKAFEMRIPHSRI
jgi:two-component sensor histidine kinase